VYLLRAEAVVSGNDLSGRIEISMNEMLAQLISRVACGVSNTFIMSTVLQTSF
jgi:hypothetical protein